MRVVPPPAPRRPSLSLARHGAGVPCSSASRRNPILRFVEAEFDPSLILRCVHSRSTRIPDAHVSSRFASRTPFSFSDPFSLCDRRRHPGSRAVARAWPARARARVRVCLSVCLCVCLCVALDARAPRLCSQRALVMSPPLRERCGQDRAQEELRCHRNSFRNLIPSGISMASKFTRGSSMIYIEVPLGSSKLLGISISS